MLLAIQCTSKSRATFTLWVGPMGPLSSSGTPRTGLTMAARALLNLACLLCACQVASAQPASFGFLSFKNSELILYTPAQQRNIKSITAQSLGFDDACCVNIP